MDIGGSTGHVSLDLLQAFPQIKCIVQDMEIVRPKWREVSAPGLIPSLLPTKHRVTIVLGERVPSGS